MSCTRICKMLSDLNPFRDKNYLTIEEANNQLYDDDLEDQDIPPKPIYNREDCVSKFRICVGNVSSALSSIFCPPFHKENSTVKISDMNEMPEYKA